MRDDGGHGTEGLGGHAKSEEKYIFLEGISLEEDGSLIGQMGQVIEEGSCDNVNRKMISNILAYKGQVLSRSALSR